VDFLLVLIVLVAVVFIVTGPLRRPEAGPAAEPELEPEDHDGVNGGGSGPRTRVRAGVAADARAFDRENELSELEAAREAKYREIRDAQLDYDTGKLSQEDFEALDSGLRREALEILQRIDRLRLSAPGPATPESAEPGLRKLD
jgi:hypothetical protein